MEKKTTIKIEYFYRYMSLRWKWPAAVVRVQWSEYWANWGVSGNMSYFESKLMDFLFHSPPQTKWKRSTLIWTIKLFWSPPICHPMSSWITSRRPERPPPMWVWRNEMNFSVSFAKLPNLSWRFRSQRYTIQSAQNEKAKKFSIQSKSVQVVCVWKFMNPIQLVQI